MWAPQKKKTGGGCDDQQWRNGAAGAQIFLHSDLVFVIEMSHNITL